MKGVLTGGNILADRGFGAGAHVTTPINFRSMGGDATNPIKLEYNGRISSAMVLVENCVGAVRMT